MAATALMNPPSPASSHTFDRLNEWFDQLTGDFRTRDEVRNFLMTERANYPDELAALADQLVENALTNAASTRRRQKLSTTRNAIVRQSVTDAALAISAGEPHGLFDEHHVISDDGIVRAVRDMTGKDHTYVGARYTERSKRNGVLAKFHEAMAFRIGYHRTEEVLTQDQYEDLFAQITTK